MPNNVVLLDLSKGFLAIRESKPLTLAFSIGRFHPLDRGHCGDGLCHNVSRRLFGCHHAITVEVRARLRQNRASFGMPSLVSSRYLKLTTEPIGNFGLWNAASTGSPG